MQPHLCTATYLYVHAREKLEKKSERARESQREREREGIECVLELAAHQPLHEDNIVDLAFDFKLLVWYQKGIRGTVHELRRVVVSENCLVCVCVCVCV